ncbi:MAG: ABC transporter ATP-binding protein/permease [Lachnospiraceae bacterium]|nr:ABC transporter ATP-binding protein/permease [Lachnospiraceae bacterium]
MIKRILSEIGEYKKASLLTPFFILLEVLCDILIPYLMASIIDEGINKGDMGHIVQTGGLMIVVALLGLLFGLLGGVFAAKASTGLARNLRRAMFDNIQNFSFANIDKFSTASLITRLTTDVTNIQNGYQMFLRMMMRAPGTLICALVMSFMINGKIASIYVVAVIFLAFSLFLIIRRAMKYFRQAFPKYDELNNSVEENVSAIRVVKAYVREEDEISRFKKASGNIYDIFVKAENNVIYNGPIMSFTVYTCILLISWIGAKMIVSNTLTTGELMSLLAYCMNILMSLMMVSIIFVMFSIGGASLERIYEVLKETPSIANPDSPVTEVKSGDIDFEDVSFVYDKNATEPVLKNINLHIRSGETVGIIGTTGSAKTSLINLISRLYDVQSGSVSVGGVDVREYDLETLRDSVSVVLQVNTLFSGSILDNLRWGRADATEEECIDCCKKACADDFIRNFPDGYNTYIEQGGSNVSGGQKQRLCIARALLKNPKVLILDDSTSAVDTATDASIRKALKNELPEVTKIIIAQRIVSVMDADKIIVMENGMINGMGTHDELMVSNDIYREVYESQTSGGGDFDEKGGM